MKKYFILAAAALSFAACSSDDALTEPKVAQETAGEVPVAFDAYVPRATTRAGAYGETNSETALHGKNFGVFGYYTDNNDYDQFAIPNFMYNQKVTYTTAWTYEPIKYWPNEYGSDAESDDYDKVTFFAYAPYVPTKVTTGKIDPDGNAAYKVSDTSTGIVGMSPNTGAGDPLVKYAVSLDPAKCVDLMWGTNKTAAWDVQQGSGSDATQAFTAGLPWLNVQRPDDATGTQKLTFQFEHALSQLNVTVDAFVDGTDKTNPVANNNKIFIRSITFTGFALKGALNLNNTDAGATVAKWMSFNGLTDLEVGDEVTIYDGQKDGREGVSPATNEKIVGLNPVLVESVAWDNVALSAGVTNTAVNLFDNTNVSPLATDPIMVIPTGDPVNVTIVYEVEAKDANLPTFLADGKTHGSRIKNTITQKTVFAKLENGKKYIINLHLGMNSVKFDVAVTGWDTTTPAEDVDLPEN